MIERNNNMKSYWALYINKQLSLIAFGTAFANDRSYVEFACEPTEKTKWRNVSYLGLYYRLMGVFFIFFFLIMLGKMQILMTKYPWFIPAYLILLAISTIISFKFVKKFIGHATISGVKSRLKEDYTCIENDNDEIIILSNKSIEQELLNRKLNLYLKPSKNYFTTSTMMDFLVGASFTIPVVSAFMLADPKSLDIGFIITILSTNFIIPFLGYLIIKIITNNRDRINNYNIGLILGFFSQTEEEENKSDFPI